MRIVHLRLLLLPVLLIGLLGTSGCDRTRIESMQELANGMRWYHQGVHGKARARFKEAVEIDPSNDQAHFYLGMVLYHQLKQLGPAEGHLRRALELRPQEAEYYYQHASVLLRMGGKDQEAEAQLRKAVSLDADHAEAYYRLGLLLAKRERYEEAIRTLTTAIEKSPRFARPYVELANIYLDLDYPDHARQVMENAAGNCPKDAEAHHEYGRILALTGDRKAAIAEYERAVALRSDYQGALFNLGMAYADDNQPAKAARYLRRYLAYTTHGEDPHRFESAEAMVTRLEDALSKTQ